MLKQVAQPIEGEAVPLKIRQPSLEEAARQAQCVLRCPWQVAYHVEGHRNGLQNSRGQRRIGGGFRVFEQPIHLRHQIA